MARAARIGAHTFVRTCESSVYGKLSRRSIQAAVQAGPLYLIGLPGYAHAAASWFRRPNGRLNGVKVLAVVRREATLSIAPADRRHASLIYDPSRFSAHRVGRGDYRVTFQVCHPSPDRFGTQFNGGFLVDGVRCVALDVAWDGGAHHRRIPASFGAGHCRG
ncbi:MAG: hypothetical protein M3Q23_05745 [Actinomycetota bacterium]|nr:hypothetical protein [Actinomycetota bacterium]